MLSRFARPLQAILRSTSASITMASNANFSCSSENMLNRLIPTVSASKGSLALVISHRNRSSSATTANDRQNLKLVKISEKDFDPVMELLLDDFIKNEPLSNALNLNRDEAHWLFKILAHSTVSSPVSCAFQAPNGKLVAMRLCNIIERPTKDDHGIFSDLESQATQMEQGGSKKTYEIVRIVNELESKTWDLVEPQVKRLLNVVILCCHRDWTRRGLVSALMECDMDEQRKMGIDGAISEATAYNSQHLFAKYGYVPIYEIKHDAWFDENGKRIFKCKDATTSAQLVFKKY